MKITLYIVAFLIAALIFNSILMALNVGPDAAFYINFVALVVFGWFYDKRQAKKRAEQLEKLKHEHSPGTNQTRDN